MLILCALLLLFDNVNLQQLKIKFIIPDFRKFLLVNEVQHKFANLYFFFLLLALILRDGFISMSEILTNCVKNINPFGLIINYTPDIWPQTTFLNHIDFSSLMKSPRCRFYPFYIMCIFKNIFYQIQKMMKLLVLLLALVAVAKTCEVQGQTYRDGDTWVS